MKTYEVKLVGGKSITVNEQEAQMIKVAWEDESTSRVTVGNTTIATASIRGIFENASADMSGQDEQWRIKVAGWDELCKRMSMTTSEEKAEKELTVRIGNAYKLANGKTLSRYSDTFLTLYNELVDFFNANPQMPRCPMKIWYPIIRDELQGKPFLTKYFEYIARNDVEIAQWCKFSRIKIVFDYQKVLSAEPKKGTDDGADKIQQPLQEDAARS